MKYLFFTSAVFSALFFFLLTTKRNKEFEHKFLAAIFFLVTINSIYVFQFFRNIRFQDFYYVPFFSELNYAIPLLYGTLLWFYTRALTNAKFSFRKIDYLHFVPFIGFFSILLIQLLTEKIILKSEHVGYPLIKIIITPFYLFSVLLILKRYRNKLLNEYSYQIQVNLYWLSWITVGAVALWIIATCGFIFNATNDVHKTLLYDYYVLSFLGVFLFVLAIVAFTKTDIFTVTKEDTIPVKVDFSDEIDEIETAKESNNNFKLELERLQKTMDEEKPFLDPLLSINKLALISKIPQYKISKILNSELNQNFYDYVNGYRITEIKERLENGEAEEFSILGVAMDSGFNSKASFNRVFKKVTGMTPSSYLKSIK